MSGAPDTALVAELALLRARAAVVVGERVPEEGVADPRLASVCLAQVFSTHELRLIDPAERCCMRLASGWIGSLAISALSFGAEVKLVQPHSRPFHLVSTQLRGRSAIDCGHVHGAGGAGAHPHAECRFPDLARQIEGLVPTLESICGTRLDLDRLRETVALSRQCSEIWREVLETAMAKPAPLTFFDGTIHMGPAVCLRGTPQALEYYRVLLAELRQRVSEGVGAVDDERLRLYWEGMPMWGRLRAHSEMFATLGVNVLASTYCSSWIFPAFDGADPFRSMARAYLELFIVRSEAYKERYLAEMVRRFAVDGIVFHDAKTCPYNSNNRYGLPQRLQASTGVPALVLSGDLNDMRCVSDEQTKINVEAFVEQLLEDA